MRIISYISSIIITFSALAIMSGCKDSEVVDDGFRTTMAKASDVKLNKVAYWPGDPVNCSFTLKNETNYPMDIREVKVVIQNLDDGGCVLTEKSVASHIQIEPGQSVPVDAGTLYTLPAALKPSSFCAVKFLLDFEDGITTTIDGTYFRAVNEQSLLTYDIQKLDYQGLPVYRQIGDMSAGFGVLKTMVAFDQGMAATMEEAPQGGTYPVAPTPEFLQRSVRKTVELYNSEIGAATKIKRVVVGTGIASVSYFATMMGAAYLPIHYLVSANSASEVQAILDYSNQNGYASYATLGYDGSMPGVGVAWIKLLALPDEYRKFIIEHEVENVIIAGIGENVKSESYCRKLSKTGVDGQEYADGSLYILYTQSGSEHDIKTISRNVVDYNTLSLEKGKDLADWESGVVNRQIDNISKGICEHTPAQVYSLIATHDMMDMYNLGANMGMYFMYKNREQTKVSVQGTYLNEYLISQPLYELTQGYIPLLFWQFVPPVSTIDRIKRDIQKVVDVYEKGILLENKTVHVNARIGKEELVQELKKRGFRFVTKRKDNVEELWNLSDGINSPCEEVVQNIVEQIGVKQYQTQCKNALYLNMGDLKLVTNNIPGLVFHSFKKK